MEMARVITRGEAKLLFIRIHESPGTRPVWFRNESYTLSVRSLGKSMERPEGERGERSTRGWQGRGMGRGVGKGEGKKRREEKPGRRHEGRLSTCVRPFSLEAHP